jgi:hypothetical protein
VVQGDGLWRLRDTDLLRHVKIVKGYVIDAERDPSLDVS